MASLNLPPHPTGPHNIPGMNGGMGSAPGQYGRGLFFSHGRSFSARAVFSRSLAIFLKSQRSLAVAQAWWSGVFMASSVFFLACAEMATDSKSTCGVLP